MGRYAFFNTGFEYKFWFGVQDSEDITRFGGVSSSDDDDNYKQTWQKEDKEYVLQALRLFERRHGIAALDPSPYEANLDGTQRLLDLFCGSLFDEYLSEKTQAYYCLGWIIYHQLMYEPNLSCNYEL